MNLMMKIIVYFSDCYYLHFCMLTKYLIYLFTYWDNYNVIIIMVMLSW